MEKLKRLREERGLSQVKLAARADLNPATVNQIERGMRDASPGTLRKLADALEVSLYELLEEEAPKAQAPLQLEEPERGALAVVRGCRQFIEEIAERWAQEAQKEDAFRSSDAALAFDNEVSTTAARLFDLARVDLAPALEGGTSTGAAKLEYRLLLETMERLKNAVEAVNKAVDTVVAEEAIEGFESLPELQQRRQIREAWKIADDIIEHENWSEAESQRGHSA